MEANEALMLRLSSTAGEGNLNKMIDELTRRKKACLVQLSKELGYLFFLSRSTDTPNVQRDNSVSSRFHCYSTTQIMCQSVVSLILTRLVFASSAKCSFHIKAEGHRMLRVY